MANGAHKGRIAALEAELADIEAELSAKREASARFSALAIEKTESAKRAAGAQAAALVAGDDEAVQVNASVEDLANREARNARTAADLIAAQISTREQLLTEKRTALAAAREDNRIAKLQAALGALREALAEHLPEIAKVATDRERVALGERLAAIFGVGTAAGALTGKEWKPDDAGTTISAFAETLGRSKLAQPPAGSWDGIDLAPLVGVGALRKFELRGPAGGLEVAEGMAVNVPRVFGRKLVELGAAVMLKGEGPMAPSEAERLAQPSAPWRASVKRSGPIVVLGHPSKWPDRAPEFPQSDVETRPPGNKTYVSVAHRAAAQ